MADHDVFERLKKHLQIQSEPELLLLKGHLILEQCLNELLRTYIVDINALEKMNLTFSRKLDLLAAMGHQRFAPGHQGDSLIREINRIRNKLAHRLDFNDCEPELVAWACKVIGHTPKTLIRRSTYLNTVRRAFVSIAAYITGATDVRQAFKSIAAV